MRRFLLLTALMALAACSPGREQAGRDGKVAAAPAVKTAKMTAPAGVYDLDLVHTSLNFRVNHIGLSRYTARFTRMEGKLNFDPAQPAAMTVEVSVDPGSIQTNSFDKTYDFDAILRSAEFFDTARFPKLTFRSTKVEVTGPNTARVTGDLDFHGVSRPIVLETTFNGGYAKGDMDPTAARVGFSAHGSIKRSEFGMSYGVPAPGTSMGVGDDVEILIEVEFTKA
jgi:polyisoprenoid-binding protein YceI